MIAQARKNSSVVVIARSTSSTTNGGTYGRLKQAVRPISR
jgi:hypothetical protein